MTTQHAAPAAIGTKVVSALPQRLITIQSVLPAPTHTGSNRRAMMNLTHFGMGGLFLKTNPAASEIESLCFDANSELGTANAKPTMQRDDTRTGAASFPRHRCAARRPFRPSQRIAQSSVFPMRSRASANAYRRKARRSAGSKSALARCRNRGFARDGWTRHRSGSGEATWVAIHLR